MTSSSLIIPLMLAAMAVFMFLSIRNQKKRAAAASQMQASVVPGTRVQMHAGVFGTVVDASGEDTVTIELAPGLVTEWNRLAIREIVSEDVADDSYEVPDSPAALDDLSADEPDTATDEASGDHKPDEKRDEK